jgi:ribosomal protein S18 acetylase RimI-like enzyme
LALEIVELDDSLEGKFLEHCNQDPLDYFFFIVDWKYDRDISKFFLAMDRDRIEGMMVIYKDSICQLRGSRDAVETLLDHIHIEEVEIMVPVECKDLILKTYKPEIKNDTLLMALPKGQENIIIRDRPEELAIEDASEVADLLNHAFPIFWGEVTREKIENFMKKTRFLGIKRDGKIVAAGNTRFFDFASNIYTVATVEGYRNQGFATSIVSTLVSEILEKSEMAIIHVFPDNLPAVRSYSKVGFRPHKTYFLIKKGEKLELET